MARGPSLNLTIAEKRYAAGAAPVLAGIDLTIAAGSVTAILGPSGIGKSTLLRLIAGLDTQFTGSIQIDGQSPIDAPSPGFVFQDPRLLPWLTVLDNIRTAGQGVDTATALSALERTGLTTAANLYPRQLSGGMQRRASLARALAMSSGLLLLDEPFVSLDRALVSEMQDLVADIITADKPTTLLVTHMPEDAARLAGRVLILAGQPAKVVADLALPAPIAMRERQTIASYVEMIEAATDYRRIPAE
ncbi:ABC transporter ATP-binding protein [Devosia sp. BK]|uniref:ABC transporter ATP-binding protein n=1 Tax=Devosia sp. BK TaxID=2871706 RepID=UPI00293AE9BA|nr:ABC transporter ATP-binding protein [Devosia sp. BK]MDV3249943.1 ABC transporter ATP-binding protein [Devosia sp. BK]